MGRMGWVPQHARKLVFWRRRGVYAALATIAAVGLGVPLLVNALDEPNSDSLLIATDPTPWVGDDPTGTSDSGSSADGPASTPAESTSTASPTPSPTPTSGEDDVATDAPETSSEPSASPQTSSPSSSEPAISACAADFNIVESWSSGFTSDLTVTNTGNRAVGDWKVTFSLVGNYKVTSSWGGRLSQDGRTVTISGGAGDSISPDRSRSFGFVVSGNGNPKPPTDIALNGTACS